MDIGTGIAIAGAWIFAGIAWHSSGVTNQGSWNAVIIATIVTIALC